MIQIPLSSHKTALTQFQLNTWKFWTKTRTPAVKTPYNKDWQPQTGRGEPGGGLSGAGRRERGYTLPERPPCWTGRRRDPAVAAVQQVPALRPFRELRHDPRRPVSGEGREDAHVCFDVFGGRV